MIKRNYEEIFGHDSELIVKPFQKVIHASTKEGLNKILLILFKLRIMIK